MAFVMRSGFDTLEPAAARTDYVTVMVDGQRYGLDITLVHDVFMAGALTSVPLAPPAFAGLINLRGRVVTAICARKLLRIAAPRAPKGCMVVGIEHGGESFGLIVDGVGEVVSMADADCQPNPLNLDPRWARFSIGIHWLDDGLLVVLDIEAMLTPSALSDSSSETATKGILP